MRQLIKAMVLMMALAIPVWAGEIGCLADEGDIGQPVVQPSSPEPAKDGNIGQPLAVSDVLIRVLPSLLALF